MSDLMLLEQTKLGDHRAFSEIVRRYKDSMFRVILRIVRNYWDAEDVLMISLADAYKGLHSYTPRDSIKFSTWLCQIAENRSIDHVRKVKRIPELVEIEPFHSPTCSCIEDDLIRQETIDRVTLALVCLNPKQKLICNMYMGGLKYKEIACNLNIPLGTVQGTIFHIKGKLKKFLS